MGIFDDFDEEEDLGIDNNDSGVLDSLVDNSDEVQESSGNIKRNVIIAVIVSLILVIVGIAIGNLKGCGGSKDTDEGTVQDKVVSEESTYNNEYYIKNNENYGNKEDQWTEISDSEEIEYTSEYISSTFTVTGIKHEACMRGEEIEVRTVLRGSLSGFTGTYELEIPYNKGVSIIVGNSFEVSILLGSYKEKTVIMEIKY